MRLCFFFKLFDIYNDNMIKKNILVENKLRKNKAMVFFKLFLYLL